VFAGKTFITDGGQSMFEQLFEKAQVIARHRDAPYAEERARYLAYRSQLGDTTRWLGYKARELIWVAALLGGTSPLDLTTEQLHTLAHRYANGRKGKIDTIEERFVRNVQSWFRYLGWWHEPAAVVIPFQDHLDGYCCWMRHERALSERTIDSRRDMLKPFLRWYGQTNRLLSDLQPSDVDLYLVHLGSSGWRRISVKGVAGALRSFLHYGASQGWCRPDLADAVHGPTIYHQETLPAGPAWADIHRMLADMNTDCPLDIRDRAIVMLFAVYGLRASEVARLRLDDVDWERECLLIHRAKRRQAQIYPLLPSVGNAIS
jgi:integrase/recombinase XerD